MGQTERKILEATSKIGRRWGCGETGADMQSTELRSEQHPVCCRPQQQQQQEEEEEEEEKGLTQRSMIG